MFQIVNKDVYEKAGFTDIPTDVIYRLEKTGSKRGSMVLPGDFIEGQLLFVYRGDTNKVGVQVRSDSHHIDYIVTSAVQRITDRTMSSINFETDGGFYKLSWRKE